MSFYNVCSKCGKEITAYLYAFCFNANKSTTEHLCDDCLKPLLPSFKCDFCNHEIKYGTHDFALAMGKYNRYNGKIMSEYCHVECRRNHDYPPIKCMCCDKIVKNRDFWYPTISEMPEGERKCQLCYMSGFIPNLRQQHEELKRVSQAIYDSTSDDEEEEEIEEPPHIYCTDCKKEIRYKGFTYSYAKDFPEDRRLCHKCECKLHRKLTNL